MIAYLTGSVHSLSPTSLILLVNNIGYRVHTSLPTLEKLKPDSPAEFFIHSHITENTFDLYGFLTTPELDFFRQLLSISGVGPRSAIEILNHPLHRIQTAILENDASTICAAKGIGRKTAERICIELKDRITLPTTTSSTPNLQEDTLSALLSLGYDRRTARSLLQKCPPEINTTESQIKWCLQNL